MKRKVVVIQNKDEYQPLLDAFSDGWKLDPWLHDKGRPWIVGLEYNLEIVAFLVKLEEDDSKETLEAMNPLFELPEPVEGDDPIVSVMNTDYDTANQYLLQGWTTEKDKMYSKNVIIWLTKSVNEQIEEEKQRQESARLRRESAEVLVKSVDEPLTESEEAGLRESTDIEITEE